MRRTTTRNPSRLPLFRFESLEDRCVFSVTSTSLDLNSVMGVSTTVEFSKANFLTTTSTARIDYTGNLLSVPGEQAHDRVATFYFADATLPGTLTTTDDGRVAIGTSRSLDIPQSSVFDLRLTSTTTPNDSYQYVVRLDAAYAPSGGSLTASPSVLLETTPISVGRIIPFPSTSPLAPPEFSPPPPQPVGGGGVEAVGPKPPAVPPQPQPQRQSVVVSPSEQSVFVAGATQTAIVASARPTVNLPTAKQEILISSSPSNPAPVKIATVSADEEFVVLELVAAREAIVASRNLSIPEVPVTLLGTSIEEVPQRILSVAADKVLTRLAHTEEALPQVATAVPLDDSKSNAESGRYSYLYLAVLVGLGTGHYFGWGQTVPNNRRGSDDRPWRDEFPTATQ
jgi:hypothetical protein